MSAEEIGLWAGFVLTLMIFSYLLGDNVLYRLAVYVFVGLAAGFITVVTVEGVIIPWIDTTLLNSDGPTTNAIVGAIPLVLGLLLLMKSSVRFAPLGNIAIAFIVGVGAAVAMVGAISGTLLPLADVTGRAVGDEEVNSFLILLGVICTLIYFQYVARRMPSGVVRRGLVTRVFGTVGQGFIVVALGALYATAIITSLTIFSERISFILTRINGS